jgi:hypothetical protein
MTPTHPGGDRVRALRFAREIASDLRWRGMPVPWVYAHMADEFQDLVRSGAYAAWVATPMDDGPPRDGPLTTPLPGSLIVMTSAPAPAAAGSGGSPGPLGSSGQVRPLASRPGRSRMSSKTTVAGPSSRSGGVRPPA